MDFLKPFETVAALQEFKDGIEIGHLSVSGAFDLCKILYIRWPINYRTKKQKKGEKIAIKKAFKNQEPRPMVIYVCGGDKEDVFNELQ
jgi:hypothetical protein